MDNKRGVKILIISFLFLVGAAYFVFGDLDVTNEGPEGNYTHVNVTYNKSGGDLVNDHLTGKLLLKNNTNYIFNFTLAIDSTKYNLTAFNITVPYNFTITDWETAGAINPDIHFMNSSQYGNWTVFNSTFFNFTHIKESVGINGAYTMYINHSDPPLGTPEANTNQTRGLNYTHATYFNFWFNATSNFSITSIDDTWDNQTLQFMINITFEDGTYDTGTNTTYFNVTVDTLPPRIWGINLSDGNTTWSQEYLNDSISHTHNLSYHLSKSNLFLEAMINETHLNTTTVYLYYYTNSTTGGQYNATEVSDASTPFGFNSTLGHYRENGTVTGSGSPYKVNFTIPLSTLSEGTNTTTFFITANDTLNQKGNSTWLAGLNDMCPIGVCSTFGINISTDVITFGTMNVTDGTNDRDESKMRNGTFVDGNKDITIRLELAGLGRNVTHEGGSNNNLSHPTQVLLYYNETAGVLNASTVNQTNNAFLAMNNLTDLPGDVSTTTKTVYNLTFAQGTWNDTTVHLLVVANDTQNYKTYTIIHNFTADNTAPTATASTDKSSITSGNSIKLSCSGSDNLDPTLTYTIKYSVGSSESTESGSSVTISPTTIGTYTVSCKATDTTQHTGTSSDVTFTVTSASTSAGVSAGGTSSGATTTIHKGEERELGELATETEEGVVEASKSVLVFEGSTASFTVSAGTSHKLVIDDIDLVNKKITVTISSDPITLEIAMGESQKADLDGDGIYDVEVKLNDLDLILGRADITITDLVAIGVEEEVPPAEEGAPPEEVVPPGEVERVGLTGLWIVLVIIIIGLVVWWLLKKRK